MINQQEFLQRRQRLLLTMLDNSVALIPAATEKTRSRDTEYAFRQDSDFHYLSGFPEPEAWLLLTNKGASVQSILFCRAKDKMAEIWQGRRIGPKQAKHDYCVDESYSLEQMADKLYELVSGHENLYFSQGASEHVDIAVFAVLEKLRSAGKQGFKAPTCTIDLRSLLHEMRLIKSEAEISVMKKSAEISMKAHERAMAFCKEGAFEYQLEAEIHHEFAMQGARHPAYGTIVGSGDNACILHYTENSAQLSNGDLVLIDAGAELDGYAADITRTFPVSGAFSEPQKCLYQLVLDAQTAACELIVPGNTLKAATDKSIEVITQGLIDLNILKGELSDNIENKSYREYYMHGLGHWLGLDVHDVGEYKLDDQDREFVAGMVLTVEPGIYIAPDADVDKKWLGIGIRIEDNLLITPSGHENLTSRLAKSITDIETLMANP